MRIIILMLFTGLQYFVSAQNCNPDSLKNYIIRASDTDANIAWELSGHQIWHNPTCVPLNKLLVHLVGTYDSPANSTYFPILAANNGYHVISLKYINDTPAKTACQNSSDPSCYLNFRKEIIEGIDYSTEANVDTTNSILNRLEKVLIYLESNYPTEGWENYRNGANFNWNDFVVSGHSQGGGHAAVLAIDNVLDRVLMFASPNDYSNFFSNAATWTGSSFSTPVSSLYAFHNQFDQLVGYNQQQIVIDNMGLNSLGSSVNVINSICPFNNTRKLFTNQISATSSHSSMIRDEDTPFGFGNVPLYENVWRYMLGLQCTSASIKEQNISRIDIYPNPFSQHTKITFPDEDREYTLDLYSNIGTLIRTVIVENAKEYLLEKEGLEKGAYFLKITSEGTVFSTDKVVVN